MSAETTVAIAVFLPVFGAVLIAACNRMPNLREAVSVVTAAALFLSIVSLVPSVLAGLRPGFGRCRFFRQR